MVLITFIVCVNRAVNMEKKCVACVPILLHKSKLTKFIFPHYRVLKTCMHLLNHITNFQVATIAHTLIHEGNFL
jgi:hypothetical protein